MARVWLGLQLNDKALTQNGPRSERLRVRNRASQATIKEARLPATGTTGERGESPYSR
jgi:hypothetical protein